VVILVNGLDVNLEILERIVRIEKALAQGFGEVREKLEIGKEPFQFFNEALRLYRDKFREEILPVKVFLHDWFTKVRNDGSLRYSHRKILEFLLERYDFQNRAFQEVHFSKLVKEARIGKNMGKKYLMELEEKGYVEKRNDGYRMFFRIKG
jgi:predicted transcriptional regulator